MTDQKNPENPALDDEEAAVSPATPEDASEYAEIYGDEPAADEDDSAEDETPAASEPTAETQPERGAGERIAKVMARAGVASRREAERMIVEGRVTVNGDKITSPALDILPTDKVKIDGQPMDAPQETRLWMYYKPVGLVTSEADEKGRQTVFDALPRDLPRVMSVGRLDLTSEGLLLLTNDGELKRRLELPSTGWLRRYRVRVNGQPTELTFGPLRRGAVIEGEEFQPMEITIDSQKGANAWLTVGIREGRNREIRRAMAHVGLTVNRLIRIAYGPFRLTGMEENEVREIKRRVLRDQLGGLMGAEGEDETSDRPQGGARRGPPGRRGADSDSRGERRPRPPGDADSRDRKPRAPRGEGGFDRKPRSGGDGGGFRPRGDGEGYKSRAPRADGEGYKSRAPRADGEGYKPRAPRADGEGYKPRTPRADGEGYKPRGPRSEGGGFGSRSDGDRKPRAPRADGEGYKPRTPRPDGEGYKPRGPRAEGGGFGSRPDGDRKPRAPRADGEGYKPRAPRSEGEGYKPRTPRADGEGYKPRGPRSEGGGFGSRAEGDRKPRAPRGEGEGYKPRAPRADGGGFGSRAEGDWDRKPRTPRGEGFADRKPRPPRAEGESSDRTPRAEGRFDRSGPGAGGAAKSDGPRGFRGKSNSAAPGGDRPRHGGKPGFGGKPGGAPTRGPRPGGGNPGGGKPGGGKPGGPRRPRSQG